MILVTQVRAEHALYRSDAWNVIDVTFYIYRGTLGGMGDPLAHTSKNPKKRPFLGGPKTGFLGGPGGGPRGGPKRPFLGVGKKGPKGGVSLKVNFRVRSTNLLDY